MKELSGLTESEIRTLSIMCKNTLRNYINDGVDVAGAHIQSHIGYIARLERLAYHTTHGLKNDVTADIVCKRLQDTRF